MSADGKGVIGRLATDAELVGVPAVIPLAPVSLDEHGDMNRIQVLGPELLGRSGCKAVIESCILTWVVMGRQKDRVQAIPFRASAISAIWRQLYTCSSAWSRKPVMAMTLRICAGLRLYKLLHRADTRINEQAIVIRSLTVGGKAER